MSAPRCEQTAGDGPASWGAAGPLRLLVADAYPDTARTLALALRQLGDEACYACDGAEALRAAAAFRPEVVLSDLELPGLDAAELARRLRQAAGPGVLLVALTAFHEEAYRRRAREAGFDLYLLKPVAPDQLRPLILAARDGGAGVEPSPQASA